MKDVNFFETLQNGKEETEGKYLTFVTDKQYFGIPIADVVQIIGFQQITAIPEFPSYAKGIIHLRGEIIPVIDIRLRIGKGEIPYTDRTCIIITNIHGHYFGFVVDEVDEVTDIEDDMISNPPRFSAEVVNQYLTGVARRQDKIILLLDPAKILGADEFNALSQAVKV